MEKIKIKCRPFSNGGGGGGGLSYIYFHRDIKDRMCIYMNVLNPFTPLVYTVFFLIPRSTTNCYEILIL